VGVDANDFAESKEVVVYCDESRHDPAQENLYMGIGSLWVPRGVHEDLKESLDSAAEDQGLGSEVKWSRTSEWSLDAYRAFFDVFADREDVYFRVLLVKHSTIDYDRHHGGDPELGFYKFYYQLLVKWLRADTRYLFLLDHKTNARRGRYATLERVLRAKSPEGAEIRRVTAHPDSSQSRLVQLSDLLTGAVTAAWCGTTAGTPKADLQAYMADRLGRRSLRTQSYSPAISKLNVFRMQLSEASQS
jgi:hypothetical protein